MSGQLRGWAASRFRHKFFTISCGIVVCKNANVGIFSPDNQCSLENTDLDSDMCDLDSLTKLAMWYVI